MRREEGFAFPISSPLLSPVNSRMHDGSAVQSSRQTNPGRLLLQPHIDKWHRMHARMLRFFCAVCVRKIRAHVCSSIPLWLITANHDEQTLTMMRGVCFPISSKTHEYTKERSQNNDDWTSNAYCKHQSASDISFSNFPPSFFPVIVSVGFVLSSSFLVLLFDGNKNDVSSDHEGSVCPAQSPSI